MMQVFKSLNLVSQNESMLNIAVSVVTVWGFLFAGRYFLKQLKIQNLSINAGKAIESLDQTMKIVELFLKEKNNEQARYRNIPLILDRFYDLQNALWLLEIQELNSFFSWISDTINWMHNDHHSHIIIAIEGDLIKKNALNQLKNLKLVLNKIHHTPVSWWRGLISHIFVLFGIVIFLWYLSNFVV